MCPSRRWVKVALPLAMLAAVAAVVRSRGDVEVWHMAADPAADEPSYKPSYDEGP